MHSRNLLNDILKFQLDNWNDDFVSSHVSAVSNYNAFFKAILWGKTFYVQFFPVKITIDKILGLNLECQNISYLLINFYLPCDYHNVYSLIKYKSIHYLIYRMSVHAKLMTK